MNDDIDGMIKQFLGKCHVCGGRDLRYYKLELPAPKGEECRAKCNECGAEKLYHAGELDAMGWEP